MMSQFKITTFFRLGSFTITPFSVFLALILVITFPGDSQSKEKRFIDYLKGIVKKQTQPAEKQLMDYQINDADSDSFLSPEDMVLYEKVNAVLEHQELIESENSELMEELALKNDIIRALEDNEQALWIQLKTFWEALAAKDVEYKDVQELKEKLALKENEIQELKIKLEKSNDKLQTALTARSGEEHEVHETASIGGPVFAYSPPIIQEETATPADISHRDLNYWNSETSQESSIESEHPWGSLVCVTCHDSVTNLEPLFNSAVAGEGSSKGNLWEGKFDASEFMISDRLDIGENFSNEHPTSYLNGGDGVGNFLKTIPAPESYRSNCAQQEADGSCAGESESGTWWNWFYRQFSKVSF
jgi:hypothetical protein